MSLKHSFLTAILVGLFTTATASQTPSQNASIAGKWHGCATSEGRTECVVYAFALKGDTLTGTITPDDGSDPLTIADGHIQGEKISFKSGYKNAIVQSGTFRDGPWDLSVDITDQGQKFTVKMTRIAEH